MSVFASFNSLLFASLLALPMIPMWAFAATPLVLGAGTFLVQVAVQGAWGVVPVLGSS